MVEHKLVSIAAVVAVWTLVTLPIKAIKLILVLLKWKYIQDKKYTILAAMLRKFRPGYPGWSIHMQKFSSRYRDLSRKNRDLGSQPSFRYEHIDIFTKEGVGRRDLGNRASPVDRTHMKRPLAGFHAFRLPRSNWNLQMLVLGEEENPETNFVVCSYEFCCLFI